MNKFLTLMKIVLPLAGTFMASGLNPASARNDVKNWEREWTSANGQTVTARMVLFDGEKVVIETQGRTFELPLDRLGERDRRWLQRQPPQDASKGPILKYNLSGHVQPYVLPQMPLREWPMQNLTNPARQPDRPPVNGRLVAVNGDLVSIDVGGGRVVTYNEGDFCITSISWMNDWAAFGHLEPDEPQGKSADELRARGLKAFRQWPYTRPAPEKRLRALPFQWFEPEMEPGKKYPLVVFLHGIGESGDDNVMQLAKHRDPLVFIEPQWQQLNPSFFMAPQSTGWWEGSPAGPSGIQELLVKTIFRMMTVEYAGQIDERRIYITGLSSGGLGAAHTLATYPQMFAAAAPISSRPSILWYEHKPVRPPVRPMWFFLTSDDASTFQPSIKEFAAAVPPGQPEPQITVLNVRGHNAWSRAYRDPDLRRWLFNQVRPEENGDWLFRMSQRR